MKAAGENRNGLRRRTVRTRPSSGLAGIASGLLILLICMTPTVAAAAPDRIMSFGPDGTEATDFANAKSVAVDQQDGSVYVLDASAGELLKFDSTGQAVDFTGSSPYIENNRIKGITPSSLAITPSVSQVAVNSVTHIVYVTEEHAVRAFEASGEPAEFTAGPGTGTNEIPEFDVLAGVALDIHGNIYASDHAGSVDIFALTGAAITSFPASEPVNLAVAVDGSVFAIAYELINEKMQTVLVKYTPDVFPVNESTNFAAERFANLKSNFAWFTSVSIDSDNQDVYLSEYWNSGAIHRYSSSGTVIESLGDVAPQPDPALPFYIHGISVLGEEREISPGKTIKFYMVTNNFDMNLSKVVAMGSNIVIGAPSIENTTVLDVTADSARLRAGVNPNTAETTYRFEYGPGDCAVNACTSVPVVGVGIGSGHESLEASQAISGLDPGTTYHYRVVAVNSFDETEGPDRTFITQSLGLGFELVDSRVWEMVSPPDKYGAQLRTARAAAAIQAARNGGGLVYQTLGSIDPDPEGNRPLELASALAMRGATGWRSQDLMPANYRAVRWAQALGSPYKLFAPDLSRAIFDARDDTPLSPEASERAPYLWQLADPPSFTPLITGREGFANVPPGTEFGGAADEAASLVRPMGFTPDLRHVVLISPVPLAAGVSESPVLYVWTAGGLQPVSVLPSAEGGAVIAADVFGSGTGSVQHAISADGSRIFWGRGSYSASSKPNALYAHDTLAEETFRLDVAQTGASKAGISSPAFQGASADGRVVFFSDSRQLTVDASPLGRDLYRCELASGTLSQGCISLTDVSPRVLPGESAEVLGISSGLSEDGTRTYFVAKGVLDTAPNQYGDAAVGGEPNLYLWQEGAGVRFIASLAEGDQGVWGGNPGRAIEQSATASPSGRYLSFMSERALTGYTSLDATGDEPVQEVFRYDAAADRLECLSCNPSGAAPEGDEATDSREFVDSYGNWAGASVAASLPQPTTTTNAGDSVVVYRPRAVLDNGRVFFNAFDSLVPGDSNTQWDVYQYESTGVGSCGASSGDAATVRSAGGCISLLSSGTADDEAGFLDASESGDDVFFLTPARLSVTDVDDEADAYDARVDGVPAVLSPRTECQGEACQPAAATPEDATPGTATFKGPGNQRSNAAKPCPKGKRAVKRRGRVRCVRRRHHRHQHRDSQRAGQNRSAVR